MGTSKQACKHIEATTKMFAFNWRYNEPFIIYLTISSFLPTFGDLLIHVSFCSHTLWRSWPSWAASDSPLGFRQPLTSLWRISPQHSNHLSHNQGWRYFNTLICCSVVLCSRSLKAPNSICHFIPNNIFFRKLTCNFNITKFPLKLSKFYQLTLLAWKLVLHS